MKKFLLLACVSLEILGGLYAESGILNFEFENGFALQVQSETGIQYGTVGEYVYDQYLYYANDTVVDTARYTLSELDWPMEPLVYSGANLSFAHDSGVFLDLNFWSGIPMSVGTMYDYDWLNRMYYDSRYIYYYYKTNYSESDATLENAVNLSAQLGWDLKASSIFRFAPSLGFRYMNYQWMASGGSASYGNVSSDQTYYDSYDSDNVTKYTFYGNVGSYRVSYYIPYINADMDFTMLDNRLALSIGFEFSPLVSAVAVDNHYLRGLEFTDTMDGGLYLRPHIEMNLAFDRYISLGLSVSYVSISNLSGTESILYTSASSYEGETIDYDDYDVAGNSLEAFQASLKISVWM